MTLAHRSQHVVHSRALGAAELVNPGLHVDQVEQALALDVAGAALVPRAGVLVFHGVPTVGTAFSFGNRANGEGRS